MSRTIYLVVTLCWMLAALQTMVFARGFAGVPAQEAPGLPGRGFLGFPAGGVGGFAGGHTYGMHTVGMPGRNEFDTLYPVTLPNLGAAGRLQPYGMPPMGVYGDFHPGGLPGMGGYAGLHPVNMPDVFDTNGVRMGGTVTGDGGAARQASHPVPPGGFETGRLRTDLPVPLASTNTDELQSFTAANRLAGLPTEEAVEESRASNAANRGIRLPTDAGMHAADGTPTGQEIAPGPTDVAATRLPQFEPAHGIEQGRAGEQRHLAGTTRTTVGHGLVGSWLAVADGNNNASSPNRAAALSVSQWFVDRAVYTPAWCETHAWAWCPAAADAADWTRTAWTVASWETAAQWLAWESQPIDYDYGNRLYYRDNTVYNGSQPVATAAEYYEQAQALANSADKTPDNSNDQWLPLGVFGCVRAGQTEPEMVFQLAINRQGVIRGNAFDQASDSNLPVQGAVDKRSQRAAWTVGSDDQIVIETGLYNLTRDAARTWVHLGAVQATPYLMIRVQAEQ